MAHALSLSAKKAEAGGPLWCQDSQRYTKKPYIKKTKTKQKNPIQTNKDLKDLHSNLGRLSFQVTKLMTRNPSSNFPRVS